MAKSIWSRKVDLLYWVFFVVHVPVILFVDLSPYYPLSIRPTFTVTLRDYYISTYRDRFFVDPPNWFHAFLFLEAVYHIPITLWSIKAILDDDPLVPLHLLVFAAECGMTTLVCTIEMLSWEGYTREEQTRLFGLYGPYLALATVMGLDMFFRLKKTILSSHAADVNKKRL